MATREKPSVVIVHGANCTPEHYTALIKALQESKFLVYCPALPTGSGKRPATATTPDDVEVVRQIVSSLAEQDKNVLMLMHSYGGIVGSEAVEGLSRQERAARGQGGGVTGLVYYSAYMIREDQCVLDIVKANGFQDLLPQVIDFRDDGTCVPVDPASGIFGEVPAKDLQYQIDSLVPFASAGFEHRLNYAAWKHIPTTYLYSTKDAWTPPVYQDMFLKQAEDEGIQPRVQYVEVGHAMQVQAPLSIVQVIEDIFAKR